MPRTVEYRLTSVQTASLAGAATVQVIQPGRIVGIKISTCGTGAATTGTYHVSCELNNQSQLWADINNPPREPILDVVSVATPISAPFNAGGQNIPLSVPIRVGDILSLNIKQTGTAGTGVFHSANVCVQENGS